MVKLREFKNLGEKGESLISIMIGVGILSIAMMTLVSMLSTQQKEIRAINEKMDAFELKNLLLLVFKSSSVCTFELNNPIVLTFDSSTATTTAAAIINVNQIHTQPLNTSPLVIQSGNLVPGSSTNSLFVSGIRLKNIAFASFISATVAKFIAQWEVIFDSSKLVRVFKPLTIPTVLTVDITTPSSSKVINCDF
jgi:hypothetical protein